MRPRRILTTAIAGAALLLLPLPAVPQAAKSRGARPSAQPRAGSGPAEQAALEQVAALMDQGRFPEAEVLVRRVLQQTPASANLHNLLGVICAHLGRVGEAESEPLFSARSAQIESGRAQMEVAAHTVAVYEVR